VAAGIALLPGCRGMFPTGTTKSIAPSSLAATSSTLSFGTVQKSKTSALSETLTNIGGSDVTISAANVSGAGFSVSGLSLPETLSPKQNLTFTVTFAPASATASGMLTVLSTAANSPLNIVLSGTEVAQGQLSVSPASLSFGNVAVGADAALNGTLGATGSSVTISGANIGSSEFVLSGISLPITLATGQTTSFTVTFKPAMAGASSSQLSFSGDAENSPAAQALAGTGTAAPQHSVALIWDASAGFGVVGYNIYRGGASTGKYSRINPALDTVTTYTDYSVAAGQTYYYVTTAVDEHGRESHYSNQTKAVIPIP
jgi:hypothetical protein